MSTDNGEKPGARDAMDRMQKHLTDNGMPAREAKEASRRAALKHHHNEGGRDPNRHRR